MKVLPWLSTARLIQFCGLWAVLVCTLITVLVWQNPKDRATLLMADGLLLLWVLLGGWLNVRYRESVRVGFARVPLRWQTKLVLFGIALALLEEAITTSMTNLAPVFGVKMGEAFITASANYIDVVCFHSVIVFIPWFIAWAVLLSYYDFPASHVLLLFGITGLLAETLSFGLQNLGNAGFWILVYGWMIYLPAYCIPANRGAKHPRWWMYPLAVLLPFVALGITFLLAIPFAGY
ncbi:MAG: hypothetical protein RBU29_16440, partial [bacterium]|nr:hypothetical protein [bacterium]